MHVFLIRHPQPKVTSSICYGHSDIALHDDALLNLKSIASSLREQLPDNITVFSSPLLRCRALAEILHTQPIYDDRLKEMHFGEWEMQAWTDIPRHEIDAWASDPLHYEIPGGESVAQMQKRVLSFINENQGIKNLALVTHSGVMKIVFAHAKKLPESDWMNLCFNYGSLHIIDKIITDDDLLIGIQE